MAISLSLNTISSGFNRTKISDNFTSIVTAFNDAVSLSATSTQTLSGDLDMDSNDFLNVGTISAASVEVGGVNLGSSFSTIAGINFKWDFDSSVSMADPGTGEVRFNNATLSSVTQVAISASSADTGNPDISPFITTWDDSSDSVKGYLLFREDASTFVLFSISGSITDNTTWLQIPVTFVAGNGTLVAGDDLYVQFDRTGDAGTGVGTVTSVATGGIATGGPITGTGTVTVSKASGAEVDTGTEDAKAVTPKAMEDSSYIKNDSTDTLTNKTFDANGTGNSLSNVDVADLADGTDGELITWDATGSPTTVSAGTAAQVLTSNGAGAAPTFQDALGGATTSWVAYDQTGTPSVDDSLNISSVTDDGTGDYTLNYTTNYAAATYAVNAGSSTQESSATRGGAFCGIDQDNASARAVGSTACSSFIASSSSNAVQQDKRYNHIQVVGALA